MIKGRKKLELTKEQILKKISPFDVYMKFSPKFKLGKKFSSPMPGREDSDPSFIIGNKYGNYFHCDYGASEYHGTCIDFVMQLKSCDYPTALRIIDTEFGLGIQAPLKDWKSVVSNYSQPIIPENEQEIHIECHYKKFTAEANKYWNAYHLSEDYLKKHNVLQVKQLYIARQRFILPWEEIVFAYLTEDGRKKIYRPTISRKVRKEDQHKLWRFRSNIPFTHLFGKENIKNCKISLGLKSRKDELVSSLILPCVYSTQAESIACFSEDNVKYINGNSGINYICYGADEQGLRESKLITSTFGWKHYNTETKYLPDNDIAEIARNYNLETVEKHMKLKGLI